MKTTLVSGPLSWVEALGGTYRGYTYAKNMPLDVIRAALSAYWVRDVPSYQWAEVWEVCRQYLVRMPVVTESPSNSQSSVYILTEDAECLQNLTNVEV